MTKIEITEEKVKEIIDEKLPTWVEDALKGNYNNPIKDEIDKVIKEKDGVVRTLVRDILNKVFTSPEYKEKLAEQIIGRIIEKGMR